MVLRLFERTFKFALFVLVASYRTLGTTHLGGSCRFEPSCSNYALKALEVHSPGYASWLIIQRVYKCRPGGPCGYDPVPERKAQKYAK